MDMENMILSAMHRSPGRRWRKTLPIVVSLVAVSLAGCLSSEESDTGVLPGNPSGNQPPSISGSPPPTVVIGNTWSFTPTAFDPDGDSLTFSVTNMPSWASFDAATGTLSGTPTLGDTGTDSGISISVSDGSLSASLPQFNINVMQTAGGSVTLSWTAPTQNEDGSALVDLAGYRIYYGTSMGNYPNRVDVSNPGLTRYVIDNLAPGTYFFVATAVNAGGIESRFTSAVNANVM